MSRLQKAQNDLDRWLGYRRSFEQSGEPSPRLDGALGAVDATFRSEVLEFEIRRILHAAAENEASAMRQSSPWADSLDTPTGSQLIHYDWWLTESTLRFLHSGIDAIAQVLAYHLKIQLKRKGKHPPIAALERAAAETSDLEQLHKALVALSKSPHARNLRSFVNHVKHAGFPDRVMWDGNSIESVQRHTSIEEFFASNTKRGPWMASDIDDTIDEVRRLLLEVAASVVPWTEPSDRPCDGSIIVEAEPHGIG